MITNTAELIERDPALPGMGRLLADPRIDYLRYKPGTSLTVSLRTADGPVFGYAVSESAMIKLEKIVRRAPRGAIREHDREHRLVLADPVADRDLPGLRRSSIRDGRLLAYKPQRRWIVGLDFRRVARCYRRVDTEVASTRWPRSAGDALIRIPAVVDRDRRAGLMITERLSGSRLDRLSGPEAAAGWLAAGRAIGDWHRSVTGPPRRAELPDVSATAEQLSLLLPRHTRRFRRLAEHLAQASAGAETGWCHGDFSADQVLIDPLDHRPAILDWDHAGCGPLAFDLGTADAAGASTPLTGIGGTGLRDQIDAGLSEQQWKDLLTGYSEVRELPIGLDRLRALAWFVRAVEPFRRADPHWPDAIVRRVDRAEELLG